MLIDLDYLRALRVCEVDSIVGFLPAGGRILEFGAGAGHQAARLAALGFDVLAIDIVGSEYAEAKAFDVTTYDGRTLPFADSYFDAIFSSNVLEHTVDLSATLKELLRVLRPGGVMVHILPSATWRLWSTIAEWIAAPRNAIRALAVPRSALGWGRLPRLPASLLEAAGRLMLPVLFRPHGEHGCAFTELYAFSRRAWRRRFQCAGFNIVACVPLGLWYTGEALLGTRLAMTARRKVARHLGSSTVAWVITGSQRTISPVFQPPGNS